MYEGLPIATNKIPLEEMKGIPHHLLGCVKLEEEPWTVQNFHNKASGIMEEIRSRGKLPVMVGGTHYYTHSLLFPKSLVEDSDRTEHVNVEEEERKWPILAADSETMLEELRKVDPKMATRWHPKDGRKIRRSLQIWLQTGKRASDVYREQKEKEQPSVNDVYAWENSDDAGTPENTGTHDPLVFWTYSSPEVLNQRLDKRVDSMVSNGLLEEVQSMRGFLQTQAQQGNVIDDTRGIWIAIGCKEMLPYITNSSKTNEEKQEGIQRTKIATKQYAKRQNHWIRLKLLHAMKEAGLERNIFLLDATDITQFSLHVEMVAKNITSAFLAGDSLPVPATLSNPAKEMLLSEIKESRYARYCEACDKTMMFEREWLKHLRSKGHKNAIKPKVDWKTLYPKIKDD